MKKELFAVAVFVYVVSVFASDLSFHSQYGQDQYLYEAFFSEKKQGVFVDIGAHNGIRLSNTFFFEKCLGWHGICIEPIPEVYQELQKNRSCVCINGCILDKKGSASFCRIHGKAEMLSGIVENYDPRHLKRIESEISSNRDQIEIIHVDTYNLTELLLEHDIRHVDYLSVDVEGSEMSILKSIDFDLIDIDVIGIENNYNEPFEEFLSFKGYEKAAKIGVDEIFVRKHIKSEKIKDFQKHKEACLEKVLREKPSEYKRIVDVLSCDDVDEIPKCAHAGEVFDSEVPYQLMHNGIKVLKDAYCGSWMTNLIFCLRGHHEPQEEKVFDQVLKYIPRNGVMIELGSYWGYYSMWFAKKIPGAVNYLIEPHAERLEVGRKNFELNNLQANIVQAYVGSYDPHDVDCKNIPQISIDGFLEEYDIPHVSIVHSDIQGAEYAMLESAICSIDKGKIDYFFISTHSEEIHKKCIQFLEHYKYTIIAECSPQESFSCDGLIAAQREDLRKPFDTVIRKRRL